MPDSEFEMFMATKELKQLRLVEPSLKMPTDTKTSHINKTPLQFDADIL